MLHNVKRPSIDSARIAEPANSSAQPVAPSAPILRNDRKHDVLAGNPGRRRAIDRDAHALWLLLPNGLRHQHMRHLRRADAEGIGAERTMGRGVAVAADDQQARQRQALLRSDHMDDALARIVEPEQFDAVPWRYCPRPAAPCARSRDRRYCGASRASARNGRRRRKSVPARRPWRRVRRAWRRRETSLRGRSDGPPRAATRRRRGAGFRARSTACR